MNRLITKELMNWLDWDTPFYTFQRAVTDSRPYQLIRGDDKTTIVINTLGVRPEDAKVSVEHEEYSDYLCVVGETKNEILNRVFNVNCRFKVDREQIKNIEYGFENGLLSIEVYWKQPERIEVDIKMKELKGEKEIKQIEEKD